MTVTVGVLRGFTVTRLDGSPNTDLDAETDALMEALVDLEDDMLFDSAVGVELSTGTVEISIAAKGSSWNDAIEAAEAAIRAAIHAVGGSTHDSDWGNRQPVLETNQLVPA